VIAKGQWTRCCSVHWGADGSRLEKNWLRILRSGRHGGCLPACEAGGAGRAWHVVPGAQREDLPVATAVQTYSASLFVRYTCTIRACMYLSTNANQVVPQRRDLYGDSTLDA